MRGSIPVLANITELSVPSVKAALQHWKEKGFINYVIDRGLAFICWTEEEDKKKYLPGNKGGFGYITLPQKSIRLLLGQKKVEDLRFLLLTFIAVDNAIYDQTAVKTNILGVDYLSVDGEVALYYRRHSHASIKALLERVASNSWRDDKLGYGFGFEMGKSDFFGRVKSLKIKLAPDLAPLSHKRDLSEATMSALSDFSENALGYDLAELHYSPEFFTSLIPNNATASSEDDLSLRNAIVLIADKFGVKALSDALRATFKQFSSLLHDLKRPLPSERADFAKKVDELRAYIFANEPVLSLPEREKKRELIPVL